MKASHGRALAIVLIGIMLPGLSGCASRGARRELQRVARDWCEVVRASQVLPVYPLTEDLQPGDVFLVTAPAGEEARTYRGRGFLPLDQHLTRLQPLDFDGFYRQAREAARAASPRVPAAREGGGLPPAEIPRAAFPSYSFEARSRTGCRLALPVQGVPVGLSFLRADRAAGSITIADARSYGVSLAELDPPLRQWSGDPDRRARLRAVREQAGRPLYLRVVNRVYLTGGVVIALQSQSETAGEARGGVAPDAGTTAPATGEELLQVLNRRMDGALPGGRVQFLAASGHSVALSERFEEPMVIGFLAFDFPIANDGSLGAPVSTLARLEGRSQPQATLGELSSAQVDYSILAAAVSSRTAETQARIFESAAGAAGERFRALYEEERAGNEPARAFGRARNRWLREEPEAERRLAEALRTAWQENLGNP